MSKPLKRRKSMRVKAPWLSEIICFVERTLPKVLDQVPHDGDSDLVAFSRKRSLMAGRGMIPPHTDPGHGPYLYLLILKSDGAILHSEGHLPLELKSGMLVELAVRKTHRVDQADDAVLVWHHVETEQPIALSEALEAVHDDLA